MGYYIRTQEQFVDSFLERTMPEPNSGCLFWLGDINQKGYGRVIIPLLLRKSGASKQVAHRVAYELFVGPVPDGMELDHKCRVRCCVNHEHLQPVTHKENLRRGIGTPDKVNKAKTHCPAGHEYAGNNLILRERPGNSGRDCRECKRIWCEKRTERRRAERLQRQNLGANA